MSDDEANRQATRTESANRGNIRYGSRGENYRGGYAEGSAAATYYPWVRQFRNQGRTLRNVYRNFRNGSR
jgi:hypothetical protein